MIHAVDPRQNRLFDPFDGVIPPVGRRIIAGGWQGVFRHVILEVMPVAQLGSHFSDSMGAPTKELYSGSAPDLLIRDQRGDRSGRARGGGSGGSWSCQRLAIGLIAVH